jgi:hypothetical protein
MLKVEYNILSTMAVVAEVPISAADLINKADRTLLYGYTCDRSTWHVYLKNGEIHTLRYISVKSTREILVTSNKDYIPDKRLYPERCDFEFCSFLKNLGYSLPFTTWTEMAAEQQEAFYGETL